MTKHLQDHELSYIFQARTPTHPSKTYSLHNLSFIFPWKDHANSFGQEPEIFFFLFFIIASEVIDLWKSLIHWLGKLFSYPNRGCFWTWWFFSFSLLLSLLSREKMGHHLSFIPSETHTKKVSCKITSS